MTVTAGGARANPTAASDGEATAPTGGQADAHYRPHLDGLRSVAVYLVVLFHAGSDQFVGGFIGVDVFFVLSGYLVTQLLMRDLAGSGRVSLRRFYSRRFRRLLPAAVVTLVVTAVVFSALASPVEVAGAEGGFRASFLYYANWHFISESTAYFGGDVANSPVLHFWSLAVEEQFYLAWPLLLGGLYAVTRRAGGRHAQVLRLLVVIGAAASLAWAWSLKGSDPNRAYYGTDARAYQLLAGAAVALTPGLVTRLGRFARPAQVASALGVGALVLAATSAVSLDAIERGAVATIVTVLLIVALEVAGGGPARWALSTSPVVYLGKVSYGTYLWHWPVIVVIARSFEMSALSTVALTALVATALASLSFQLMEHPIRISPLLDRWRSPVIVSGLAISVVSALVVIPAIADRSTGAAAEGLGIDAAGLTPVPDLDYAGIARAYPPISNCYEAPADDCILVRGDGPHLMVIGDSHAAMMVPGLIELATQEGLTLSAATRGGCPWQLGLYVPPFAPLGKRLEPKDCEAERADAYDRVIPELDPDIVVVMNLGYETRGLVIPYRDLQLTPMKRDSPEFIALLRDTTRASLAQLTADGRRVVILEPTPINADQSDAVACLSDAEVVESCRYVVDDQPTDLERLYRRVDEESDLVWSVDLDRQVCPFLPICDPIVDGRLPKMDGSHLSQEFSRSLAPVLDQYLRANGILDP